MTTSPYDDPVGDWAASGVVALTGRPDGPPLVPPGVGASAARAAQTAFTVLAPTTPATPAWHHLLAERAAILGLRRSAPWSPGGACRSVRTRDGWLAVSLARPDDVAAVPAVVQSGRHDVDGVTAWRLLDEWAAATSTDEALQRLVLLGLPAGAIPADSALPAVDVVDDAPWLTSTIASAPSPPDGATPLVADLSALWAGPLATQLLSTAGATVVKVESTRRPDGARAGHAAFFDLLHGGHDSVLIDEQDAADRRLLHRLVERADIVVVSARPRALDSLGLDPADVCRRTPTTWVHITAYGCTGPDGARVGFGDDVAMAGGLVVRDAATGRPFPCGDAIADPLTGMQAAVAALTSYRAGGSRIIDIAMHRVVAATVAGHSATPPAAVSDGSGWSVPTGSRGLVPVEEPRARSARSPATAAGRDTEKWRQACRA